MTKKLHILFLCGWYPSMVLPNNGDFIERHAKSVSLLNKVSVLHIISDENCKEKIKIEIETKDGITSYIAYIKKTKTLIGKLFLFYKAYEKLLLKIGSFDVIHLNTLFPFGIFAVHQKLTKKKPFIISEHWTGYHQPKANNLPYLRKFISKIIVRKASYVCPVSNDLKKSMEDIGFKGNYKSVPNVVNTNLFYPKENTNSVFTILHASNLVNEHKNIEGILRVITKLQEKIPAFIFKLVGENVQQYKPLVKELNIGDEVIVFRDHISHKEVAKELNNSNVFLLFSNYENLPCVILEAFATGTPVISTDVGGISEYFPKNFGFLIEKGNEDELLEKIIAAHSYFKTNKQKMFNYVQNHFSEKIIANQFTTLYTSSLNNKA